MQQRIFTSDSYALDWAKNHIQFDSSKLVSKAPWMRIYRLNGQSERAYLKLLPPALTRSPITTPSLARRFPKNLPEVISRDAELGLLLERHYSGRRLDDNASPEERRKLVQTYADIQTKVSPQKDLLGLFQTLVLDNLVPQLLSFLDPSGPRSDAGDKVGSVYFFGRSRSRRYFDALSTRAELLGREINASARLPSTINHCDLRLKNATFTKGRSIVLTNWDDATVGPAGLSLHALFSGCATPAALLGDRASSAAIENAAEKRYVLDAYIDALVKGQYAPKEMLQTLLPGAICAGAIQHLIWYSNYPDDSSRYRRRVRRILRSRLSDLLDFCDLLALRDTKSVLQCAQDYKSNGTAWRAESLLRRYLSIDRNNTQAHAHYAGVLLDRGKREQANAAFIEAIELAPNNPYLMNGYGRSLMEELRFDEAITVLRRALHLAPSNNDILANLDRASQLRDCYRRAEDPEAMPILPISDAELKLRKLRPESVAMGAELFKKYGVLLVENPFDPQMIHACDDYFLREYSDYFEDKKHADALSIGDKRFQITFALEGPFNDPDLYGNPFILSLMTELLGNKYHLGCTVCALSLPGSKDQHLHKDHRALFTKNADDPPMHTPPFAITMMVPLVDLDEMSGTTTLRKGSQLLNRKESAELPRQVPIVSMGSCFLMDLRVSHQGLGNRTSRVRPILNMVYQQRWFADNKNYEKQPPLRIPPAEFQKIPEQLKRLFSWTTQPGPDV